MKPAKLLIFVVIELLTTSAICLASWWAMQAFQITGVDPIEKTLIIIPVGIWFIQFFVFLKQLNLIPKEAVHWQDRYL